MNPLIEAHYTELEALCQRFHVRRLDLFGSAATGEFKPESSDLDFVVEFKPANDMDAFHQYFVFLEALERLFGRKVDLIMVGAMKNPHFIQAVNRTRRPLYAA